MTSRCALDREAERLHWSRPASSAPGSRGRRRDPSTGSRVPVPSQRGVSAPSTVTSQPGSFDVDDGAGQAAERMRAPMASPIEATACRVVVVADRARSARSAPTPTTAADAHRGIAEERRVRRATARVVEHQARRRVGLVLARRRVDERSTGVGGAAIDSEHHVGGVGLARRRWRRAPGSARRRTADRRRRACSRSVWTVPLPSSGMLVAVDAELRAAERVQRALLGEAGRRRIEEGRCRAAPSSRPRR